MPRGRSKELRSPVTTDAFGVPDHLPPGYFTLANYPGKKDLLETGSDHPLRFSTAKLTSNAYSKTKPKASGNFHLKSIGGMRMSQEVSEPNGGDGASGYDIEDVLKQLEDLEGTVSSTEERREVRRTRRMLERVPGNGHIRKYTTRDVAEGFVGGIIFSLPLLVEDGVFEIAEWFAEFTIGPLPVFMTINVVFIVMLIVGLLYYTDIREIKPRPLFGLIPKRLVGVLTISFFVAFLTMFMWGRLHVEDPTRLEQLGRVTVIWTAAAFGATLGDILPGESKGEDIGDMIVDLSDGSDENVDPDEST